MTSKELWNILRDESRTIYAAKERLRAVMHSLPHGVARSAIFDAKNEAGDALVAISEAMIELTKQPDWEKQV